MCIQVHLAVILLGIAAALQVWAMNGWGGEGTGGRGKLRVSSSVTEAVVIFKVDAAGALSDRPVLVTMVVVVVVWQHGCCDGSGGRSDEGGVNCKYSKYFVQRDFAKGSRPFSLSLSLSLLHTTTSLLPR